MATSTKPTLTLTCHCKAIQITFPTPEEALNECQCSICRRYGALWAYYEADEVQISGSGSTTAYVWQDKEIEFHHCDKCACVTHWQPADKSRQRRGINCRMLERQDLEKRERRLSEGPP